MNYRPWGLLDWALGLDEVRHWFLLGALGTEERSLAVWRGLCQLGALERCRLLEIHDIPSHHTILARQRLAERRAEFEVMQDKRASISANLGLMDEFHKIDAIARAVVQEGLPVILDITSLPKRYFFPILRAVFLAPTIRDLIITYTSPSGYLENAEMSENADDWAHLPGFAAQDDNRELLIAGVGFMAENLQSRFGSIIKHAAIKMLIPFPAPLATLNRSWEAVFQLEGDRPPNKFENYRVDATDMSAAFDRIVSLVRNTDALPAFAPFGPKPISAAMCLYAIQRQSAVYYPQPKVYHPDYSKGVGKVEGKDAVFAYWVKHNGRVLYQVPTNREAA